MTCNLQVIFVNLNDNHHFIRPHRGLSVPTFGATRVPRGAKPGWRGYFRKCVKRQRTRSSAPGPSCGNRSWALTRCPVSLSTIALAFSRHPTEFLTRMAREHGDVVRIPVGQEQIHLLAHPDDVRDVLVTNHRNFKKGRALERAKILLGDGLLTSEGESHLRQRRLMLPSFHGERMRAYEQVMREAADRRIDAWPVGEPFTLLPQMQLLTLDVMSKLRAEAGQPDPEVEARRALLLERLRVVTLPTPPLTSITSTSRAATSRGGCSWGSARSRSPSTWGRSSTS